MNAVMGNCPFFGKGNFPDSGELCGMGKLPLMHDAEADFIAGLAKIMEAKGIKDAPLSERAGLGVSFVRDLKRGKASSPRLANAGRLATSLGMSIDQIIAIGRGAPVAAVDSIAVAGRVGAGARVPLADPYAEGDGLYQVRRPAHLPTGPWVAVEVVGDSMEPAYEEGDLLIYRRQVVGVPAEALGRRCVCADAEGNAWVKRVRRRDGQPEGLFDLVSINLDTPPLYDVALHWAAPIAMHLQKDFAERLEELPLPAPATPDDTDAAP